MIVSVVLLVLIGLPFFTACSGGGREPSPSGDSQLRIATYNASMARDEAGQLRRELEEGDDPQVWKVASIIRTVRPDILLLNEFDYDPADPDAAPRLFNDRYLGSARNGLEPWTFKHWFVAPVNTGVPSGQDLNGDGEADKGPGDAFGFGRHPGHFGMVVFSRHPIARDQVRTFQKFRWSAMPGALRPPDYYSDEAWNALRLSSKSHWDLTVDVEGDVVHILASHPTPPVFDGEEDRNGRRNHDEIRMWADYVSGRGDYLVDDFGVRGGLGEGDLFVIVGDQNADPSDGDSHGRAIRQLLELVQLDVSETPKSEGGLAAAVGDGGVNADHGGDARTDTADFSDGSGGAGNLRVDYVLPSSGLQYRSGGVFWPSAAADTGDRSATWIDASDHRLVWIDVDLP